LRDAADRVRAAEGRQVRGREALRRAGGAARPEPLRRTPCARPRAVPDGRGGQGDRLAGDRAAAGPRQPGGALLAGPRLREGGAGRGGRARARGVRQARQGAAHRPLRPAVGGRGAGGRGAAAEELTAPHFFLSAPSSPLAVSRFAGTWPLIPTYFSSSPTASGTRLAPTASVARWKYGSGLAGSSSIAFLNAVSASGPLPAFRHITPSANWNFASCVKAGAAASTPSAASCMRPSSSRTAAKARNAS